MKYETDKYFAKLPSPLNRLKCTTNSSKKFINHIRNLKAPHAFQMVSFKVTYHFTSASSDETVDITL